MIFSYSKFQLSLIGTVSNIVFSSHLVNNIEPSRIVYIMQQ